MVAVFGIGVELSWFWALLVIGAGASHLAIDCIKKHSPVYIRKYTTIYIKERIPHCIKKHPMIKKEFMISQFLQIVAFVIFWWLWGECVQVREHYILRGFLSMLGYSSTNITLTILGLLIVLKPVGIMIEKGDIWDFNKGKGKSAPNEDQKGAGKMIGYLERTIVLFLLINNQFSAIAFVLAAKSVMRFPEIGKSNDGSSDKDSADKGSSLAEFYLIGTLLSMTSVFIVAFMLGLIGLNT